MKVDFASPFDLEGYQVFLQCKKLPEFLLNYDWEKDSYQVEAPARFAHMLGVQVEKEKATDLPYGSHLFDYQVFVTDIALRAKRFACWADTGLGKALRNDTLVATPSGWIPISELSAGDFVIGSNGKPCAVLGTYPQGVRPCYRVTFNDGAESYCDADHLWTVNTKLRRSRGRAWRTLTLAEIDKGGLRDGQGARHFVPTVSPVQYPESYLPVEPYLLGVLLGDGHLAGSAISVSTDDEIISALSLPAGVASSLSEKITETVSTARLTSPHAHTPSGTYSAASNPLLNALRDIGLAGTVAATKFIPLQYLSASVSQRILLLQGLLDTDGYISKDGTIQYSSASSLLIDGLVALVRSLGGVAKRTIKLEPRYVYKGQRRTGQASHILTLALPDSLGCPFRLARKAKRWEPRIKYQPIRSISRVEPIEKAEMTCIKVDSDDGLFVIDGYILTHNTNIGYEFARQVAHCTSGRVLIITPLNIIQQWREQVREFYGAEMYVIGSRDAMREWCAGPSDGTIAIVNPDKFIPRDGEDQKVSEVNRLAGVVLDESSLLRSGGGVIKWAIIHSCRGVEYKLSMTATPAPNEVVEYASQGSFLEKLRSEGEILWTYFVRDKEGNWNVKPHAREAFYRFMSSWSIYLRSPSRYGFADNLKDLPPPEIYTHRIQPTEAQMEIARTVPDPDGQLNLFRSDKLGITARARLSQAAKGFLYLKDEERTDGARPVRIVDSLKPEFIADLAREEVASGHQVLLWTLFDAESDILADLLKSVTGLRVLTGSVKIPDRIPMIEEFRKGNTPILITRASILGHGLNFQNCTSMIFSGFDDSFEQLYQAIRRAYRYGQTKRVRVHVPYIPELEGVVWQNLQEKQGAFDRDTEVMERCYIEAMREGGSLTA